MRKIEGGAIPDRAVAVPDGILVGEYTDRANRTGVSVIYFSERAVAGMYKYGGATSTRQTDSLEASHAVSGIDAIVLAGGSAFGLDAGCGAMRWLREHDRGIDLKGIKVPIVPCAAIFDLRFSTGKVPDCDAGYRAFGALSGEVREGSLGAGTGATVGKINGMDSAMKAGIGTTSCVLPGGVSVWAYVVVNAFGDVMASHGGVMAGARKERSSKEFLDTAQFIRGGATGGDAPAVTENTTLCVVVTDARFDKSSLTAIARMASAGIARSLSPAGTSFDGDVVFAVSTGHQSSPLDVVGDAAARLVEEAIRRAVLYADGLGIVPSYRDLGKTKDRE